MVRPEYGNSIVEIPGTVSELLDAESNLGSLEQIEGYENVENVVLIFIDAFGYSQWKNFDSGLFRKAEENGELHKITSTFPSATPVTLTSVNTGLQPVEHSLLGWEMYYEELDMIIQTLPFADRDWIPIKDIVEDADPSILFEGEAFHSILENEGISTYGIPKEEVKDSEYSNLVTGEETETRPYNNIAEMAFKVREVLNQESGKKYIYAYTDLIDKTCHEYGPGSEEEKVQLENISDSLNRELGKVDEEVAKETLVLFSADHGQIKASEEIDLMKYEEVEKRLEERDGRPITPCGSARSVFLHVKGGEVEDLKEFLEKEIDAEIYRTEKAVEKGLFGDREIGENFYSRAGELLIIPNGRKAYWYDTDEYEQEGFHGGLHEDEMFVPFALSRLSELL
mgnify:CR=1 FL=1